MNVKPKYKLGQKVIIVDKGYVDGKSDVGYIIGIEVRRSYNSAGIFQFGGLSVLDCERDGYLETYMNNVDEVVYHVIRVIHTTGNTGRTKEVLESKLVPYNKENVKKYVE
jgi:hypothetical protein